MEDKTQIEQALDLLNWACELLEKDERPEVISFMEAVEKWVNEEENQGRI